MTKYSNMECMNKEGNIFFKKGISQHLQSVIWILWFNIRKPQEAFICALNLYRIGNKKPKTRKAKQQPFLQPQSFLCQNGEKNVGLKPNAKC